MSYLRDLFLARLKTYPISGMAELPAENNSKDNNTGLEHTVTCYEITKFATSLFPIFLAVVVFHTY
jgi:hypothetical protein